MRLAISALIAAALPVFILAADAKLKDLIVGKWESVSGTSKGVVVEYKADGTTTGTFGGKQFQTGKYKFTGEDMVEVEGKIFLQGKEAPYMQQYKVEVAKESMTMTNLKTKMVRKLKRVK